MAEFENEERLDENVPSVTEAKGPLGGDVFGPPDIRPKRYRCEKHGVMLAADVIWDRDNRPLCPICKCLLQPED